LPVDLGTTRRLRIGLFAVDLVVLGGLMGVASSEVVYEFFAGERRGVVT
jgi:hypothetical protein